MELLIVNELPLQLAGIEFVEVQISRCFSLSFGARALKRLLAREFLSLLW